MYNYRFLKIYTNDTTCFKKFESLSKLFNEECNDCSAWNKNECSMMKRNNIDKCEVR